MIKGKNIRKVKTTKKKKPAKKRKETKYKVATKKTKRVSEKKILKQKEEECFICKFCNVNFGRNKRKAASKGMEHGLTCPRYEEHFKCKFCSIDFGTDKEKAQRVGPHHMSYCQRFVTLKEMKQKVVQCHVIPQENKLEKVDGDDADSADVTDELPDEIVYTCKYCEVDFGTNKKLAGGRGPQHLQSCPRYSITHLLSS